MERVVQQARLQALFEGAALGAPQLGGEGPTTAQPIRAISQDEFAWARDFDLFGPGPQAVEQHGDKGVLAESQDQSDSVEARVTQLTNIVQELAKLVATSVAATGAQPLESAALSAPATSSSSGAPRPDANSTYRDKLKSLMRAHARAKIVLG